MINKKTVFVVGAGGSAPFGFPYGSAFFEKLCNCLTSHALQSCGFTHEEHHAFYNAFYRSGQPSIDFFLERRPEFMKIGKAAIAKTLLPFEEDDLFGHGLAGRNWYKYLFASLAPNRTDFERNRVTVITFNYDRSLEHYLFVAIQNSYDLTNTDSASLLSHIPFYHVHGQLGYLPWQRLPVFAPPDGAVIPYGGPTLPARDKALILGAANCIRVMPERENLDDNDILGKARQAICEAELVLFLGFGYDDRNMQKLGIKARHMPGAVGRSAAYAGSHYGMTAAERSAVASKYGVLMGDPENCDVLMSLRHNGWLL